MAYNICTTPPRQTLFLGCSIASFTVSVGWNQQVGELTVELVEDTCSVPVGGNAKVYWDYTLTRQETMGPDPGFIEPNLGAPVYFRVGDFEWCGLVQSFEINHSAAGYPVYTVKLMDPRQVLEGTQLIINNYAGSTHSIPNLINVYGYSESFGTSASLTEIYGVNFGSPAGGFGGSETNDNGMPWYVIQGALRTLTSAVTPLSNSFTTGRLQFRDGYGISPSGGGASETIGYGIIPGDGGVSKYILDLNEMPVTSNYWKIAGTSVGLLAAITDICERAACDYYIELLPSIYAGNLYKVIKVRTVSRAVQPSLTAISDFLADVGTTGTISYSTGKELRNEPVASFVVGGYQQNMYQLFPGENTTYDTYDYIKPYFGVDPITGNAIQPYGVTNPLFSGTRWAFTVSTAILNQDLFFPVAATEFEITEAELLASTAGFDVWQSYGYLHSPDSWLATTGTYNSVYNLAALNIITTLNANFFTGVTYTSGTSGDIIPRSLSPLDICDLNLDAYPHLQTELHKDKETVYKFINTFATQYYGTHYMVRMPDIAAKQDSENLRILATDEPTDGAWIGTGSQILQLEHPTDTDFFSLDDGRVGPICSIPVNVTGVDYTTMGKEDYYPRLDASGQATLFIKASVEPELVFYDKSTRAYPHAVVTIPGKIGDKMGKVGKRNASMDEILAGNNSGIVVDIAKVVGGAITWQSMETPAITPYNIAIPIKSNVQTYGPWYNGGTISGPVQVEQDNGLVPWEYGSNSVMNAAGTSKVFEEVGASMQVAEMGSISVPGYPLMPLGAELGAYNNGVFGAGYHLVEHRTTTTGTAAVNGQQYIAVPMTGWTGLYGPNITSISVRVGTDGIQTSYGFRTFTPAYGRFSRANAERLKTQTLNNIKIQKQGRLMDKTMQKIGMARGKANAISAGDGPGGRSLTSFFTNKKAALSKADLSDSPHHILIGQNSEWISGGNRATVATIEVVDIGKEFYSQYRQKAFMSMEGMFRPVSVSGLGGLPRFATGTGNAQYNRYGGLGPLLVPSEVMPTGSGASYTGSYMPAYNLNVNSYFLNPFMSQITHNGNMRGTARGHDVAILGIGETAPNGTGANGINPSINLYNNGTGLAKYETDYKFLSLRGPIVLQGWGYDLDGKPIPNKIDTLEAARSGVFSPTGLQDTFMDNWLTRSDSWPVGPIDLRFDRNRGVWTVPQYQLTFGTMITDISSGGYTGLAQLAQNSYVFDSSGNQVLTSNDVLPSGSGGARFNVSMVIPPSYDESTHSGIGYNIYAGERIISLYSPEQNSYIPIGREQQTKLRGVLAGTLACSGSALFNIWSYRSGVAGTGEYDTGEQIIVNDWLLNAGQTVAAGTKGVVYKDVRSRRYYLIEASCSI